MVEVQQLLEVTPAHYTHSEVDCMRRSILLVTWLVCALSLAGASVASAQVAGFKVTTIDVGPAIVQYLEQIDATLAPFGGLFIVHGARSR